GEGDLLDGLGAAGRALDVELALLPHQVFLGRFQQVRGDLARLIADLAGGDGTGRAGRGRAAAGVGAQPVGGRVGVALFHLDVAGRDAQLLGDDLGVGGLVPLALRLRAEAGDGFAGRVHAQLARVEHLDAQDVERLRRTGADDLGERRDADA